MAVKNMRVLRVVLAIVAVSAETRVAQQSNPHIQEEGQCEAGGVFSDLLERPYLGASLSVQQDTFLSKALARTAAGSPIELYDFKQPARLSSAELPFSIAPVAFPVSDPRLVVDSSRNCDSWFLGHCWRVVGATNGCGRMVHLGWRFSSADGNDFLALIVRRSEDESARFRVGNPATVALAALLLHHTAARP